MQVLQLLMFPHQTCCMVKGKHSLLIRVIMPAGDELITVKAYVALHYIICDDGLLVDVASDDHYIILCAVQLLQIHVHCQAINV